MSLPHYRVGTSQMFSSPSRAQAFNLNKNWVSVTNRLSSPVSFKNLPLLWRLRLVLKLGKCYAELMTLSPAPFCSFIGWVLLVYGPGLQAWAQAHSTSTVHIEIIFTDFCFLWERYQGGIFRPSCFERRQLNTKEEEDKSHRDRFKTRFVFKVFRKNRNSGECHSRQHRGVRSPKNSEWEINGHHFSISFRRHLVEKNLTCWQMGSNNVISFLRKLFSSCKTCDKIVLWRE